MIIKIIDNIEDLIKIRNDWDRLLKNSSSDAIFLTWDWVITWWEIFGQGNSLYVISLYAEGRLVGIVPLLANEIKLFNITLIRKLEFICSGEEEKDEICSEYLNIIAEKGLEKEVIANALNYIINSNLWDVIILRELNEENINTDIILEELKKNRIVHKVINTGETCFITLPDSWDKMLKELSSNHRYNIRRDRKKLSKYKEVVVKGINSKNELDNAFDVLVELHQKRWGSLTKPGCFSSEKFTRFHKRIIKRLFNKGQLHLIFLYIENKPVAAFYEIIYENKVLYYQSGFDVDYDPKLSIGNILRAYSIEKAISEGFREYDFLKGADKRHCREWSNNKRKVIEIKIYRKSLKELICSVIIAIKKKLRIRKLGNNKQHKAIAY